MSKVHSTDDPESSVQTGDTMPSSIGDTRSPLRTNMPDGGDRQDPIDSSEAPLAYTPVSSLSVHHTPQFLPSNGSNATWTGNIGTQPASDSVQQPRIQNSMLYAEPQAEVEIPRHTDATRSAQENTESCLRSLCSCPTSTSGTAQGTLKGTCSVTGEVVTDVCRGRLCEPGAICDVATVVGCMAAFICPCGCCCDAHEDCIDIH